MNKSLASVAVLAGIVWLAFLESGAGQAQGQKVPGPGDGDAVLKFPGSETAPVASPRTASPVPATAPRSPTVPAQQPAAGVLGLWNNPLTGENNGLPQAPGGKAALAKLAPPNDGPDPNQDILVKPELGPWMISVMSYTGNDAPRLARQLALELRNTYKLPAYVFNHGAEERRKEYERVRNLIEKQKEALKQASLSTDQPLRVRYTKVEDQCAVLVGGYPSDDAAQRGVAKLKSLKPPDPTKVALHTKFYTMPKEGTTTGNDSLNLQDIADTEKRTQRAYVNPFRQAFVVRNPCTRNDRPQDWDKLDINVLKQLNSGEPLSLLQSPKPVTLAVKLFQTPTVVQSKSLTGAFLESLSLGGKTERVDAAAHSAHNLAECLRKSNLKAYVLHTKYSSVVTVGEFDSIDDPGLRAMQNVLTTRLKHLEFAQLFPTPLPMQVPK